MPRLSETTPEERTELFALLDQIHTQLQTEHDPDCFNIRINVAVISAAGRGLMFD